MAIAGLAYIAFDRFPLSMRTSAYLRELARETAPTAPEIPEKSVAVLPFVDMSEKHDQEYFSDGLSEELIDHLARTSDLRVIARTSSFQFKGKRDDIRNIGQLLGVANLLEGSVRTSGKSIRITAQLIKVSDGSLRWSQSYDRNLGDIFKLQDEIAEAVGRALNSAMNGRILRETGQSTANMDAYDALLQGRYWYDRADSDNAIASYLTATKLDPQYALAWGEPARAYTGRAFGRSVVYQPDVEAIRKALAQAFAIDPKLSVAHSALGLVQYFYDWNWAEANVEFTRAHQLDPNNVTALRGLGRVAETLGQYDEALNRYNQALSIDPLSARTLSFLAAALADKGLLDQSEVVLKKILKLYPSAPFGVHSSIFRVLLARGEPKAALESLQAEPEDIARNPALPIAYWALGRRAESDSALHELEVNHANELPFSIAASHAYRGETDDAFFWLTKAFQQRDTSLVSIKIASSLRAIRNDVRYARLLHQMNLPE